MTPTQPRRSQIGTRRMTLTSRLRTFLLAWLHTDTPIDHWPVERHHQ